MPKMTEFIVRICDVQSFVEAIGTDLGCMPRHAIYGKKSAPCHDIPGETDEEHGDRKSDAENSYHGPKLMPQRLFADGETEGERLSFHSVHSACNPNSLTIREPSRVRCFAQPLATDIKGLPED